MFGGAARRLAGGMANQAVRMGAQQTAKQGLQKGVQQGIRNPGFIFRAFGRQVLQKHFRHAHNRK